MGRFSLLFPSRLARTLVGFGAIVVLTALAGLLWMALSFGSGIAPSRVPHGQSGATEATLNDRWWWYESQWLRVEYQQH